VIPFWIDFSTLSLGEFVQLGMTGMLLVMARFTGLVGRF